jgi:hypothetical protein
MQKAMEGVEQKVIVSEEVEYKVPMEKVVLE